MSFQRRLRDLQGNQGAKRLAVFGHHELDELNAVADLAKRCFGRRGLVEANIAEPGALYIGYYLDGKRVGPNSARRRLLAFRGMSHRELAAQVKLWEENGRPAFDESLASVPKPGPR